MPRGDTNERRVRASIHAAGVAMGIHMLEGYSLEGEDAGSRLFDQVTFALHEHPKHRATRDD
jgi:hypothetical protein